MSVSKTTAFVNCFCSFAFLCISTVVIHYFCIISAGLLLSEAVDVCLVWRPFWWMTHVSFPCFPSVFERNFLDECLVWRPFWWMTQVSFPCFPSVFERNLFSSHQEPRSGHLYSKVEFPETEDVLGDFVVRWHSREAGRRGNVCLILRAQYTLI